MPLLFLERFPWPSLRTYTGLSGLALLGTIVSAYRALSQPEAGPGEPEPLTAPLQPEAPVPARPGAGGPRARDVAQYLLSDSLFVWVSEAAGAGGGRHVTHYPWGRGWLGVPSPRDPRARVRGARPLRGGREVRRGALGAREGAAGRGAGTGSRGRAAGPGRGASRVSGRRRAGPRAGGPGSVGHPGPGRAAGGRSARGAVGGFRGSGEGRERRVQTLVLSVRGSRVPRHQRPATFSFIHLFLPFSIGLSSGGDLCLFSCGSCLLIRTLPWMSGAAGRWQWRAAPGSIGALLLAVRCVTSFPVCPCDRRHARGIQAGRVY